LCSKSKLTKPWYRASDTAERNAMARKACEAVLTVTLRKPDSAEYKRFSDEVKARAKREYNETISGDEEVVCFIIIIIIIVVIIVIITTTIRHEIVTNLHVPVTTDWSVGDLKLRSAISL